MTKTIVVGGQYGDEGKGKILSYLAGKDDIQVLARGGVGANAGHQVFVDGKLYSMRMLPAGSVVNRDAELMIGAGVLVDPDVLLKEIETLEDDGKTVRGRIGIDRRATLVAPEHKVRDTGENSKKVGTTGNGCGPAMSDRAARIVQRTEDCEELKPYIKDVERAVNEARNVLVEGTQGFMLSNTFGTWPYVTSKDVSASTIAADVGLGPTSIDKVIVVVKAFTTRVGNGPLPDEVLPGEPLPLGYEEHGTVTGRLRRVSKCLHNQDIKTALRINGATDLAVTKIDIRFPGNDGVTSFDKLTTNARNFLRKEEKELGVPITLVGTGKEAKDVIDMRWW